MDIEHLLSPADVIVGLRASDKRVALQALARHLATKLNLSPEDVLGAVLRREELGSTGLGNGVAVSHARHAGLDGMGGTGQILREVLWARPLNGVRPEAQVYS